MWPDDDNLLKFSVNGDGVFRAVANEDTSCLEQFNLPQMHVFKRILTAVIQSTEKPGKMVLKVESIDLKNKIIGIKTKKIDWFKQ